MDDWNVSYSRMIVLPSHTTFHQERASSCLILRLTVDVRLRVTLSTSLAESTSIRCWQLRDLQSIWEREETDKEGEWAYDLLKYLLKCCVSSLLARSFDSCLNPYSVYVRVCVCVDWLFIVSFSFANLIHFLMLAVPSGQLLRLGAPARIKEKKEETKGRDRESVCQWYTRKGGESLTHLFRRSLICAQTFVSLFLTLYWLQSAGISCHSRLPFFWHSHRLVWFVVWRYLSRMRWADKTIQHRLHCERMSAYWNY